MPESIKTVLKKIRSFSIKKQIKMSNTQARPRRPVRPPGMGVKNMDNRQRKLRRYEIERFLAQPKNIEVKQNGGVVQRMVVRRSTVYPGTRRRNYY